MHYLPLLVGEIERHGKIEALVQQLTVAAERLAYGTACLVQSYKVKPKGKNKTHQTLARKMGS